jgi:sodium/hydrogen antiporter
MRFEAWYILLGGLMLAVTFLDRLVRRLPITTTIVYLVCGFVLGPLVLGIATLDPVQASGFLERVTEIALMVSIFTAGLKLRALLNDPRWRLPMLLAFLSMTLTVAGIALFGTFLLGLPIGAAILLGGILAPTDPVLASDVQLEHPKDRDRLRFSLTGEAGMNDGSAFAFVVLGLGMLGHHQLGAWGWRWLFVDVLWAIGGGFIIGGILGTFVGRIVCRLRAKHEETVGRDELISLGLIGLSYGVAVVAHAYGFLAVFAAGVAMRHIELSTAQANRAATAPAQTPQEHETRPAPETVPQTMVAAVLDANEQVERILEVGLVLLLSAMISSAYLSTDAIWLALALFFVIRPISVLLGTVGTSATPLQKALLGWFGIRGIGSIYYLMYAIQHGLNDALAKTLSGLVLSVVAISVLMHGISVTPIMTAYERRRKTAAARCR